MNVSAFVWVMVWNQIGDKPLSERMLTMFFYAMWCYKAMTQKRMVSIGYSGGLVPIGCQAITWTNVYLSYISMG